MTYALTSTDPSTSATTGSFYTRTYTGFQADGSFLQTTTFSNAQRQTRSMTTDGKWTSNTAMTADGKCTNSVPVNTVGSALTVGQSWSVSYTQTCQSNLTTVATLAGSVNGIESVTTPAGTFNAYKVVQTETGSQTSVGNTTSSYEKRATCWREVHMLQDVACDEVVTSTSATGLVTSTQNSSKLIGMSVTKFAGSVPTVARFAGSWSIALRVPQSITYCSAVANETGALKGSCMGALRDLVGTVDVNGSWHATRLGSSPSDSYDGTANTLAISNTQTNNGMSWTAQHD
ncbi:hypothetical protein PSQ40_19085 [Curvibacter sp. HBC61]|uniref:Uncharacterized protein n=1 Tax=Curvibacter cyanobacteriorum TaxID=3026422 RepID=A0ABT5N2Z5_9BURK|nr:hypothetical protein [Curvibacter sp. HBC61]MDD0840690.1 hypothetical protein [Curvibacter sp. HBC61]